MRVQRPIVRIRQKQLNQMKSVWVEIVRLKKKPDRALARVRMAQLLMISQFVILALM